MNTTPNNICTDCGWPKSEGFEHGECANVTEEMIERAVESKINSLDRRFMKSDMTQEVYDAKMAEIRNWADGQYKRLEPASDAKYVDYRLVPNSTDEAAVLTALQAVSPKFKMDGVAVAATFELTEDPREAVLAVSKRFNVSVMRLEWGHREPAPYYVADIDTGELTARYFDK